MDTFAHVAWASPDPTVRLTSTNVPRILASTRGHASMMLQATSASVPFLTLEKTVKP